MIDTNNLKVQRERAGERAVLPYLDIEGWHAAMVNLLANLMFLSAREGLDFDAAVDTAEKHFAAGTVERV